MMKSIHAFGALLCVTVIVGAWTSAMARAISHRVPVQPTLDDLERAQSITFTAATGFRMAGAGQAVITEPGDSVRVAAQRPGSLRIEAISPSGLKPGDQWMGFAYNLFVSDGSQQLEAATASKVFETSRAAGRIREAQGKHGLPVLIGASIIFAVDPLRGFRYVGETTVGGKPVSEYSRKATVFGSPAELRLFIARPHGLPVRLKTVYLDEHGRPSDARWTDYANWNLEAAISPGTFDASPPPGMHADAPAKPPFDPSLKKGRRPVPLWVADVQGRKAALYSHAGRVVLLDYWATWCGPCLAELPNVKAAYDKYHRRGLDIIGISLDDESTRARLPAFAKKHGMTWPQVCDGKGFDSPLATVYKLDAIPFTLLIGRDGKIAAVDPRGPDLEKAIRAALARK